MRRSTLIILAALASTATYAQDSLSTYSRQAAQNNWSPKPGDSKFMIRGYYHTGLDAVKVGDETNTNFNGGGIAPILMYKQSDRLFFEAEFEGEFEDGAFQWGLEYADMAYVINKYMTIRAGKFLLPFGSFMEKFHPAWINRFATKPLGFGHDGLVPTSDVGVELRGAFHLGDTKLNYQAYAINGPQLKDGSNEPDEAGGLMFGYMADNNNDKSFGGRVGIFPLTSSALEIGFSALSGNVGTKGGAFENLRADLYAVDLSFVRNVPAIKSVIDVKGQYNFSQIGKANFVIPEDTTGAMYDFTNSSSSYYAQLSIRPSFVSNKFLRNLELVGRYSAMETPKGSMWESAPTQLAIGLNYWIDWRTVIKFGYQTTDGLMGHEAPDPVTQEMLYVHWAMGF